MPKEWLKGLARTDLETLQVGELGDKVAVPLHPPLLVLHTCDLELITAAGTLLDQSIQLLLLLRPQLALLWNGKDQPGNSLARTHDTEKLPRPP